jgi:hypothetical protein
MQALARFAIRPADDGYTSGDLILGAMFRDQSSGLLNPNHVYEVREVLGVLTLVEVGESAMGMYPPESTAKGKSKGLVGPGWCSEVGHLLDVSCGRHLVTCEEIQRDLFVKWLSS